jgi:hypothetical protein
VTTAAGGRALARLLPDALAVEMEGAALARFVIDVASVHTRLVVHDSLRSLR